MTTIALKQAKTRNKAWSMARPVDFTLNEGEHIAIVGRNGAGKSMLVDMITSRHPCFHGMVDYNFGAKASPLVSQNISYIAFRDTYGGDNDRTYFLQQRWNQTEIDESTPTVGEKLEEAFLLAGADTPERRQMQQHLYDLFCMNDLLDKYIILLSSGELRKFKLTAALFTNPRVLIMDNPFIGLDITTRRHLDQLLTRLAHEQSLQIVLVLSRYDEIPMFITHVVEVSSMTVLPKKSRQHFINTRADTPSHVLSPDRHQAIQNLPCHDNHMSTANEVIGCHNVSIRYGQRTILNALNWQVNKGEHWALSGKNGSGKSTLLSLVCADNPQGYACDITLFGRQRGSGESIWDIKRHIGYVSPEMHRSYQRDIPALQIVASGLKDSVGLYLRPTAAELDVCRWWMGIFGIHTLADRSFLRMSSGEQRLVLLARAFVKDPELLILDEPLHGLDNVNRQMVKDIIETFCRRPGKTLIFVSHYQDEFPGCIDHTLLLGGQ